MSISLEVQQRIQGADGTLLWAHGGLVRDPYTVISSEASASFAMGEAVVCDPTNLKTTIPRNETTAAGASPAADLPMSFALYGKRISATTDYGFLGVAQEGIAPGGYGFVAGPGSIVSVKVVTTNALTYGFLLGGSSTAGLATNITISTTLANVLGIVLKINAAVGSDGTGSTGWAGILVNPA